MATLSTHVLDLARGVPAAGLSVGLFKLNGERELVHVAVTNAEGRTDAPLATDLQPGDYELAFAVMDYFALEDVATFYDEIPIRFRITDAAGHYHVPLLLSPWGYSTYRGSSSPPK
ncbi:MAG: hydroxyisourate hydrolase [Candidatus Eremiobacteraeota bacterium]|nr:hydroxyisourate hydrolase [Candidatus Eremiobacteraeota bacterium]